jgi:hypothetical protein
MATSELEILKSRVSTLEAEVARLKSQITGSALRNEKTAGEDWLDKMYGIFADYPDFDEVVELGRKYRESLRPKIKKKSTKKSVKKRKR